MTSTTRIHTSSPLPNLPFTKAKHPSSSPPLFLLLNSNPFPYKPTNSPQNPNITPTHFPNHTKNPNFMAQSQNGSLKETQSQPQPQDKTFGVPMSKYSKRVVLRTILAREDRGLGLVGERVVVGGWVRSCKEIMKKEEPKPTQGGAHPPVVDVSCSEIIMTRLPFLRSIMRDFVIPFVHKVENVPRKHAVQVLSAACLQISDGSCASLIQIIIGASVCSLSQVMPVGTSILVEGVIQKPSESGKHAIQIVVEKVLHVGVVDPNKYPLSKTRSSGILRLHSHLRPRTTTIASTIRIRNSLFQATHTFFQENGILNVHMPVITTTPDQNTDEKFQVTTLLRKKDSSKANATKMAEASTLETVKAAIKEKSRRIEELKRSGSNREALLSALQDLRKANELAQQLEEEKHKNDDTSIVVEKMDFSKDYFGRAAYLSNAPGLHLESYACALSSVYALGPVFEAKRTRSKKDLAEMWMLDVDLAFAQMEDAMNCAEDYMKFNCQWMLQNCSDELKFASKRIDQHCIDRIRTVGSSHFQKITYTEAVETLSKVEGKTFNNKIEWGSNLYEEHESYLVNEVYKQPLVVYDHPKDTKPFFMRLNDDKKTVSSFDIIIPMIGKFIEGGEKEERIDVITSRIEELALPRDQYEWYLDLRRHGTVRHSGFSVGFEKLVMLVVGIEDARDVIPFPRTVGNAYP